MKKIIFFSIFIISLVFLGGHSSAEVRPPKNPNSAKGCAICHYRWIDTFFVEGKGTDLVEYQSEKVAAEPEMCFSCHDGSVLDSRARIKHGHEHETGSPPPSHMKIPKEFPLDEAGNMQCATCHTAHGVSSGKDVKETIFLRISNRDSAMCRKCHPDMDGGTDAGNHPIGDTRGKITRRIMADSDLISGKEDRLICETCHTAHGSPHESLLVKGSGDSGLCLDCHGDKDIFTPDGERKPYHVVNVVPEREKIPEKLLEQGARLGYNGEIICQTCHKVHKNRVEKHLLLIKKDNRSGLCLTCHSDKRFLEDTKHNLARSAPGERNLDGKTVAEAGMCSACHLPHKRARKLSGKGDMTARYCKSCHSKGSIAERVNLTGNTHPLDKSPFKKKDENILLRTLDVDKEKLSLPLFNRYGVQDKDGVMTCKTCHATHGARSDSADGEKTAFFLRKGPPHICRECHMDKFSIENSKHDLAKVAPMEKNILNQTPLESGLCGTCHLVHKSSKDFLWAREISQKSNTVVQGLCMGCHNEKGMAKRKVNQGYSHPVDISPLEEGHSTSLPLFDKDGKYSKDGIMTCHTCHDPHQWNVDTIKKESGRGQKNDKTTYFLRKQSPHICRECHGDKFTVANTRHDLSDTAMAGKNTLNQTPSESGLCSTCHIVHNAKGNFLWAREIPRKNDTVGQGLCMGCHNEKGMAKKKVIIGHSHPVDISPLKKELTTTLPLFDRGGKFSKEGIIACHTCHDPHRWNPDKMTPEDSFVHEGNSQNSFLRLENLSSPRLCEDCHPDRAYVVNTDHDLLVTAPSSKNIMGRTPAESGTCGVCHLVHNSEQKIKLWARGFSKGESIIERMCNSCHSKNGSASNKIPPISSHPEVKFVDLGKDRKDRPDYSPIFDKATGKHITAGDISCPTCHNVHQWSPGNPAKGSGVNLEGNATSSFLRAGSSDQMCRDCHGIEALFKFKFFHEPGKRSVTDDVIGR